MSKKKDEIMTGLGNTDKLIVQKSKPLFALWKSELTLAEFKILDTYLARIDSHHPERRTVLFDKGELEHKLGVKRITRQQLEDRLRHLMGNVVEIPDEEEKKGFKLVTLFESAEATRDEFGQWQVKLECTQKAMKYIFNIDNLGYSRYKLRCIASMASRYTYIMFIYLESCRNLKGWSVSLPDLKKMLNCDKEETYKQYKRFNDLILKKVYKEITEKTECKYDYEPIKRGRTVVGIKFTVYPLHDLETLEEPKALEAYRGSADLWQEPLEVFAFSPEELEEIRSVLITVPDAKLPQGTAGRDSLDTMRYHYIDQKTKEIIRRDKQKPIKSKCAYLMKMIRRDSDQLPGHMDITDYAGVVPE